MLSTPRVSWCRLGTIAYLVLGCFYSSDSSHQIFSAAFRLSWRHPVIGADPPLTRIRIMDHPPYRVLDESRFVFTVLSPSRGSQSTHSCRKTTLHLLKAYALQKNGAGQERGNLSSGRK